MFVKNCLCIASIALGLACLQSAHAQEHRSAWMWSSSGHPYGAYNIVGDNEAEAALINDFELWGFDRIYTSLGTWPTTDPERVAHWNAGLDAAGIQSQMLLGEATWIYEGSARNSLLNLIQSRLINYNLSRVDTSEWIDAVHLDIEPHALTAWKNGTDTDRRDLLLLLRDTYADVRDLLDTNGQTQIEIYADLPVWFDSSSSIAWNVGERDQWFTDIALSLDGISMMAYERSTLSHINSGVQWEIDNFNGEVRIGLESNAIGPGETFLTFDDLLNMADALDAYHGTDIGGIDFHPLTTFADQAEHAPVDPTLEGDVNGDGFVGLDDLDVLLTNWNQSVPVGDKSQGDLAGIGDGYVGLEDLDVILNNWNASLPASSSVTVPEPAMLSLSVLGVLLITKRR